MSIKDRREDPGEGQASGDANPSGSASPRSPRTRAARNPSAQGSSQTPAEGRPSRPFFRRARLPQFPSHGNFEAQEVDFVELCCEFHPGKSAADLTVHEQVDLIRHALRKKDLLTIDPHCTFMKYFDLIMAVSLIFTGVVTPYEVIFMRTVYADQWLFWISRFVDAIFLVDVTLQFFLKIEVTKPGTYSTVLIKERSQIRKQYLRTWFPLDIVGIAPFDIIFLFVEGSQAFSGIKILRCLRLFRLIKVVRILRTSRLVLRWQTHFAINFSSQKLVKFCFLMMLASHWMACLWGLVGLTWGADLCDENGMQIQRDIPLEEVSWITTLFGGGKTSPDSPCDPWHVYMASLHWAVMTITSIGYGDIVPVRNVEYAACVACMLSGGVLWAYIIGSLCSIISNADPVESKFETSTDLLNTMMRESGLETGKRFNYREYLREAKAYETMRHFRDVASQFSPQLKGELLLHVSQAWTRSVFYLKDAPERVLMELAEALDLSFFARKEELQQHCNCLRLVERGTIASAGRILTRGDAFNIDFIVSNVLWRRFPRTMSLTYSMVMALERAQFTDISERFPSFRSSTRRAAVKIAITRCMGMCAQRSKLLALSSEDGSAPSLDTIFHQMISEGSRDEATASSAVARSIDLREGGCGGGPPQRVPVEPSSGPSQPPPSSAPDTLRRRAGAAADAAPAADPLEPAPLAGRLDALETGLEATLRLVQRQLSEVRALRQEAQLQPRLSE